MEKKSSKNIPPLVPLTEVVEAVARHQEAGYSPSTNDDIPQSGEKSSADLEFFRKRLHQQINPIVRDGKVRDEYAFLLENKEFTPQSLEEYQKKGMEWILNTFFLFPTGKESRQRKTVCRSKPVGLLWSALFRKVWQKRMEHIHTFFSLFLFPARAGKGK